MRQAAAAVPQERLLVETDSPYLAPVPHRGQTNEPALLPHVGKVVAQAREQTVEKIEEVTCRNAIRVFAWGKDMEEDDV